MIEKLNTLIFVYNSGAGFLNGMFDSLHKTVSPNTYACDLCAITHTAFGPKPSWKRFLRDLNVNKKFLHKEEFYAKYVNLAHVKLPAVLLEKENSETDIVISSKEVENWSLDDLIREVSDRI